MSPSSRSRARPTTRAAAWTGALAAAFALALMLAGPAGPAAAHSELVGSSPAAGARLKSPPKQVRFTLTQAVSTQFASTALTVQDAASRQLTTRVEGRDVVAEVPAASPGAEDGAWQVSYRVVSADRHPISGTVSFAVAAPATARQDSASPRTKAAPSAATPTSTTTTAPPASAARPGNTQPASNTSVATLLWLSLRYMPE